jgi:hypothetical protein
LALVENHLVNDLLELDLEDQNLRKTFKNFTQIVVYILAVIIATWTLLFLIFPDCSLDSKSAQNIRSLSQERLAKLHADMERFSKIEDDHPWGYRASEGDIMPVEFADLDVAKVHPKEANIMVSGCFDNFLYMSFEGIDDLSAPRIILKYSGEHESQSEVLWPK